jgi:excisionase family DNA binding protein
MAGRGRSSLTSSKRRRGTDRRASHRAPPPTPRPLVYTAQDLARFCEVDLKTIHHWADGGKIPHHRTSGRHLRFRRNHILAFLRRHGYPLHAELADALPTVFVAITSSGGPEASNTTLTEDVAKKLSGRFFVRRFDSALAAIAHLIAGEPDALVLSIDDPTWSGVDAIRGLKSCADTAWPALVVVTDHAEEGDKRAAKDAGADLLIEIADIGRLSAELARMLGVD